MEDCFRFTLEATPFADIPSFYCSPCERPFSSWDGLVSHVLLARAHRDIKSEEDLSDLLFPCGGCNRTFKSSESRFSHLLCSKRHKLNPKGYPDNVGFTCDACDRDYPTAGSLHAHASHSQKHLKKLNNKSKLKIKAWFHVTTAIAPIREEVTAMAEEVYCNGLRVTEKETATNSRNAAIEEVTDGLNGVTLSSQPKAQKNKTNRRRRFQGRGARKALGSAEDINLPYKCVPCNRAYKSAYALADHKRQSPAHKQEPEEELKPALRPRRIMEEEVDVPYPWSKFPYAQREELFKLLEARVHGVFNLTMHRYQVQEDDDQDYENKHYMCLICKEQKSKESPATSIPAAPPTPAATEKPEAASKASTNSHSSQT
ncbi:hypothetical protein KEM56_004602 [Ascosphaera pollenicola]|nr:hypothetical protein KEM56_004602 [Ascosphaera pollenicola]